MKEYNRPGAAENLTVGDVIKAFISALNILHQNPNYNRAEIFGEKKMNAKGTNNNIMSRFSRTEG